jgi:hypothetical protein
MVLLLLVQLLQEGLLQCPDVMERIVTLQHVGCGSDPGKAREKKEDKADLMVMSVPGAGARAAAQSLMPEI